MAGYTLREGLSFCRIDGRSLFLDLQADRYFCLGAPLDRAFSRLLDAGATDPVLEDVLVAMGLIVASPDGVRPCPCPALAPAPVARSRQDVRVSVFDIAMALAGRALWNARVGRRPLAENVHRLERQKCARASRARPAQRAIPRLVEAYRRAALVVSTRDRCLATSMALMSALIARGARPDLLLGVKLDPFQAHCWVELDGAIVNDEPDFLRPFTPIRVV